MVQSKATKAKAGNPKAKSKVAKPRAATAQSNTINFKVIESTQATSENSKAIDTANWNDEIDDDLFDDDDSFEDDTHGIYVDSGQSLLDPIETRRPDRGIRSNHRGLTVDKTGNVITQHITTTDIYDGGLKFLTANHVATSTLPSGIVLSIPELFNYQQFEIAARTLKIEAGKQDPQVPPDFPGVRKTLDYIFDEHIQPGPILMSEVEFIEGDVFDGEVLPDIEIAKLMLLRSMERWRKAPYAYQENGQVRAEYRDVLKRHMDDIGATDKDKHSASPRGFNFEEWTPERIQKAKEERAEKAATSHWDIHLKVPPGYQSRLRCKECGDEIEASEKKNHVKSVKHKTKNPMFDQVSDPNNTLQLSLSRGKGKKAYTFSLPTKDYPDEKVVRKIADGLIEFYSRLSCRFHENMKITALALVCQRVRDEITDASPRSSDLATNRPPIGYPQPHFLLRQDGPEGPPTELDPQTVRVEIYLFEPGTLQPYKIDPYFQPAMMLQHIHVPDVPDCIIWTNRQREKIEGRAILEPITDIKLKIAVKLAKFMSFKMYGKVIDELLARKMIGYYRSFYENAPVGFESFDKRHTLFNVTSHEHLGVTRVRPKINLRAIIQGDLPNVIVHTLQATHIANILNQGLDAFLLDGNPLNTWKVLCQSADALNAEIRISGIMPETRCQCTAAMKLLTLHHCPGCFKIEVCSDMSMSSAFDDSILRCRRCVMANTRPSRTPKARAELSLRCNIRQELGITSRSSPEAAAASLSLYKSIWKDCEKPFLEGESWKFFDKYTDAQPLTVSTTSPKYKDIMAFSMDAIFPYLEYRDISGQWVRNIHCPSNISTTTVGHNLAKGVQLPGVLHLACVCWSHSRPDGNSALPVTELHDRVMEQADEMHLVRIQTPWTVSKRHALPLNEANFLETKKQWILSAPPTATDYNKYKSARTFLTSNWRPPREWKGKPEGWEDRTLPIIFEMERRWTRKLPRGADGCPFPGHPWSIPPNWSFWLCRTFFTERVARMWYLCNGAWPQVDTAETLFLSACLSYLDLSRQEWLNLPISYYNLHPFRISFGHTLHDRMLRSGWIVSFPSSLSQHDDSLNNLEVETAMSNYFKHNAPDAECAKAKDHLLSISLLEDLYCPRKLLRPHHRKGPRYEPWSVDDATEGTNSQDNLPVTTRRLANLTQEKVSKLQLAPSPITEALSPIIISSERRRGFENFGQFCWMNSTVQFLYMIEPLRQAVILFSHIERGGNSEMELIRQDMIRGLGNEFKALDVATDMPIDPQPLMEHITALRTALELQKSLPGRIWTGSRGEDVHEVIVWLLEQLELADYEPLNQVLLDLNQQLIEQVTKKCTQCPQQAVSLSTVPLPDQNIMTLYLQGTTPSHLLSREEHLSVFVASAFERSSAQYTEACLLHLQDHGTRELRLAFTRLPEYLIIHLSRTMTNQQRLNTRVIGTEGIDLAQVFIGPDAASQSYYELCSEIRHDSSEGVSTETGHYFTHSKILPSEWLKFNDGHVSKSLPFTDSHGRTLMLLFKRATRPSNTPQVAEDNGALSALDNFTAKIDYQKIVVDMFYQHRSGRTITLKDLLLAVHDGKHIIHEFEKWRQALYQVAAQIKWSRKASAWLLRESYMQGQGQERVIAVLSRSQPPNLNTDCYLVRYMADDPSDEHAIVSWQPEKIFWAMHITGPIRRMIEQLERANVEAESMMA